MNETNDKTTNRYMRFAAMLAGHCCNRHQIFNHQWSYGDLINSVHNNFKFSFLTRSVAGRDVFQMPAQQQAVDVVSHFMRQFIFLKKTIIIFLLTACTERSKMKVAHTKSTEIKDSIDKPLVKPHFSQSLKVAARLIYNDGSMSTFDILNDKSIALWNTIIGGGDAIKPSSNVKLILNGYVEDLLIKIKVGRRPVIEKRLSNFVGQIESVIKHTGCEEVKIDVFGHDKILFNGTIPFHCGE